VAEYQYDGDNRRIVKKLYSGGSLSQTKHIYLSVRIRCWKNGSTHPYQPIGSSLGAAATSMIWSSDPRHGRQRQSRRDRLRHAGRQLEYHGPGRHIRSGCRTLRLQPLRPIHRSRRGLRNRLRRNQRRRLGISVHQPGVDAETGLQYFRARYYHDPSGTKKITCECYSCDIDANEDIVTKVTVDCSGGAGKCCRKACPPAFCWNGEYTVDGAGPDVCGPPVPWCTNKKACLTQCAVAFASLRYLCTFAPGPQGKAACEYGAAIFGIACAANCELNCPE
jgi:hypothetical protein